MALRVRSFCSALTDINLNTQNNLIDLEITRQNNTLKINVLLSNYKNNPIGRTMQFITSIISFVAITICTPVLAEQITSTPNDSVQLEHHMPEVSYSEKEKAFQQLNHLFNLCYKTHEKLILEQQSIIPFGAFADTSGNVNYIHLNDVGNASKEQIINAIKTALIKLAKQQKIFAAAIFQTEKNFETKDGVYPLALVAQLEHANGLALAIASEFSKENENSIQYATPITSEIPSEIFYWAYKQNNSSQENIANPKPNQS
jgi:hypothetical protein